jgi:hypothetical protein
MCFSGVKILYATTVGDKEDLGSAICDDVIGVYITDGCSPECTNFELLLFKDYFMRKIDGKVKLVDSVINDSVIDREKRYNYHWKVKNRSYDIIKFNELKEGRVNPHGQYISDNYIKFYENKGITNEYGIWWHSICNGLVFSPVKNIEEIIKDITY